jgi:hypothetical protein
VHELGKPGLNPSLGLGVKLLNYRIAVAHTLENTRNFDCQIQDTSYVMVVGVLEFYNF